MGVRSWYRFPEHRPPARCAAEVAAASTKERRASGDEYVNNGVAAIMTRKQDKGLFSEQQQMECTNNREAETTETREARSLREFRHVRISTEMSSELVDGVGVRPDERQNSTVCDERQEGSARSGRDEPSPAARGSFEDTLASPTPERCVIG